MFLMYLKSFIHASANVLSGKTNYPDNDIIFDAEHFELQTPTDGKRNMKGDLRRFNSDFGKAVKEAKTKYGKAASAK